MISLTSLAATAEPKEADACPLSGAEVEKLSGLKFVKTELLPWTFGQTQCKHTLESGFVQLTRATPEAYQVKTEAEIAAKLEQTDAKRRLKDWPVPAYSFTGGVNVVLPGGQVWQVLVMQGPKRGLDAMALGKALAAKKEK
ncbi:MAG: hypothetical protein U0228_17570 [Myxococcaceae bacterium]